MLKINQKYINSVVKKALSEDLYPKGDLTTNLLLSKNKVIKAKIIAKQNGIISGLDFCKTAFKLIIMHPVTMQIGKKPPAHDIVRVQVLSTPPLASSPSLGQPNQHGSPTDQHLWQAESPGKTVLFPKKSGRPLLISH